MLKHPVLTRGRAQAFLEQILKPSLVLDRHPLKIEINENPAKDQREAEAGPWTEVGAGYEYGPAYATFWFRLSGTVPERFAGKATVVVAEVGGERTVWRDNSPWCGVDVEHSDFGWLEGSAMAGAGTVPKGGEELTYIVQCYTRNSETRVSGKEPPRKAKTERVSHAEIQIVDTELKDLVYDVDFVLGLLGTIAENDPAEAVLLRALNDCANAWAAEGRDAVARCRRLLKEAQQSLSGDLAHTIYPVGHAHLDTAWLWPLEITRKKMAHTTATQLGLLERYPEYVFVHSQASQYEWLETEHPALFERVKAAVKRGQWEPVGSMWVEADCNLTGAESLVRQFLYGRRYFRDKLGVTTDDMWLPDVFGYSAALPQILAKFNIKYFLTQKISWNQTNKFPHHTFYWQGIDGTKVWTHFPPADTYNASAEPKEIVFSVRNYRDHGRADQSLYVYGFGDGGGGPTERHLELLKRGRNAPNFPEVALGKRALDFFRESRARSRDLATWTGELYLELHRGTYTSQAANKRSNRETEFLMRDAELLACFAPGFPGTYPKAEIEAAWKLILLNQFHDIIPGSSVREVYEDSDRDYAEIRRAGEAIVDDALRGIASKFDTSGSERPVAVFHNATAPGLAEIAWPEGEAAPGSFQADGETVPVQLVEAFGERKLIFPTPVAAQGAVAVGRLLDAAPPGPRPRLKASPRRIENGEWSVSFDRHGNITSIASLEDGSEFVAPNALANVFQLLDDKPLFWSAWDVDAYAFETAQDLLRADSFEIVERGPVRAAVETFRRVGAGSTIRQRISLGAFPGIRFDTEVDWREEDKMLKVAFPVNVNAARATYEIQFGNVERPTHQNTSWEIAKFEVCAQKWVDLSEGEQGVALINQGKYGHDVRGNVMRLSLLRSPKAPDPLCDMGVHRFSYLLLPHYGPYHLAGVVPAAYAFNAPVRTVRLDAGPGEGGALPAFVSVDDKNLVIESVKKAEDSDALIVRLYEAHNCRGRATLSLARPFLSASLCDLEENDVAVLDVDDAGIRFDYRPFEIVTIKIGL